MTDIAIKIENISKKYEIGTKKSGSFRETATDYLNKFNFINKNKTPNKEDFWALQNISLEIKKGEAVGIIGKNGAGKSTLLKILSRITQPTTGRFEINGRVSALLEVGTGFHPELTGRENVYLNGTILGMTRQEIKTKFDEIIDFAGIEKFLDTPVKRYSSGMYVRLAFSVAAHLEPEILIVDEVLSVGDAEFQKKCLGKMDDVTRDGRTILFVSHNMAAIQQLTKKSVLLLKGSVNMFDNTSVCVREYLGGGNKNETEDMIKTKDKNIDIDSIKYCSNIIEKGFNKPLIFDFIFNIKHKFPILNIGIGIYNSIGARLLTSKIILREVQIGTCTLQAQIKDHHLPAGNYSISLGLGLGNYQVYFNTNILSFEISDEKMDNELLIPYLSNLRDKIGAFIPAEYFLR